MLAPFGLDAVAVVTGERAIAGVDREFGLGVAAPDSTAITTIFVVLSTVPAVGFELAQPPADGDRQFPASLGFKRVRAMSQ